MEARLVLVEWIDSAQPVGGWHFLSDVPALKVVRDTIREELRSE